MDMMWRITLLSGNFLLMVTTFCEMSIVTALPNCSFPAVYSFGDSLTDNGNAIAALPDQFSLSESNPYGLLFPHHAADRYCDGRLLVDYIAFAVRRRPNYAILRGIAADFTYGANFAFAGSTARNSTVWQPNSGFNSPFSLNIQVSWLYRYRVRLEFYYSQNIVNQSLPSLQSLNGSLYMVNAGYQDYFACLYNQTLIPEQALDIVPSVVDAIITAIRGIYDFGARYILVVNLPPLGCIPALLTRFQGSAASRYDRYGCLIDANEVSKVHNTLLGRRVDTLRTTYPNATFYLGDYHKVYNQVLKNSSRFGISNALRACCGYGGEYNFNTQIRCGSKGRFNGSNLDLSYPCMNPSAYASWDGVHPSQQMNWVVATAFMRGKHITPRGGFECSPDYSNWWADFDCKTDLLKATPAPTVTMVYFTSCCLEFKDYYLQGFFLL